MAYRIMAGLAVALLASTPALACGTDKVLFSDDFKQVDSSWGFDSPDVQVDEGKVKVKPQPDISNLLVYKGILFTDANYCVTVRMPNKLSDHDNTMGGPIFWAKDYDNYYMFMITPSGYAEITRKVAGKWMDVVEWKLDPNIKRGVGANNLVEVRMQGADLSVFINDQPFATVKGQPPEGGGQIGMRAQSEKNQVDTWKFTGLKVTTVPGAVPAPQVPAEPARATIAPNAVPPAPVVPPPATPMPDPAAPK